MKACTRRRSCRLSSCPVRSRSKASNTSLMAVTKRVDLWQWFHNLEWNRTWASLEVGVVGDGRQGMFTPWKLQFQAPWPKELHVTYLESNAQHYCIQAAQANPRVQWIKKHPLSWHVWYTMYATHDILFTPHTPNTGPQSCSQQAAHKSIPFAQLMKLTHCTS